MSISEILYNKLDVAKYLHISLLVLSLGSKENSGFVLCAKWKFNILSSEISLFILFVYPNKYSNLFSKYKSLNPSSFFKSKISCASSFLPSFIRQ